MYGGRTYISRIGSLLITVSSKDPSASLYGSRSPLLHQMKATGLWHCYALGWWRVDDIWGYLVKEGIPYNDCSFYLEMFGLEMWKIKRDWLRWLLACGPAFGVWKQKIRQYQD